MGVAVGDRPFGDVPWPDENGPVRGPILVVDDDRQIRELVRRYLESDGSAVLTAATGAAALEMLRSAPPALVVLDLGLPDVPGETVLREIRAAGDVPVLILSARAGEEDRLAGLGRGERPDRCLGDGLGVEPIGGALRKGVGDVEPG